MSTTMRVIGLILAFSMMLFSGAMYIRTQDWVAVTFLLGSLGYVIFFMSTSARETSCR